MLDTVFGVPIHPLIVHATSVVVPTAALAVLLYAVWPRFRRWAGWGPLALAVLSVVLAPLSTSSGEELEERVRETNLLEEHAELGEMLIWWVIPLAVVAAVLLWWHRGQRDTRSGMAVLMIVVSLVAAAGTLVQVVLIGHSGAEAAWSDAGSSSTSEED